MTQTNTNENQFIKTLRAALGIKQDNIEKRAAQIFTAPNDPSPEQTARVETIKSRQGKDYMDLLDHLSREAVPLNLKVIPVKDETQVSKTIADLVKETEPEWRTKKSVVQWDHPLINALDLKTALKDQAVPVYTAVFDSTGMDNTQRLIAKDRVRQQMIDAYIGVTSADFCLADTATLVMKSRPKEARSVSLLPAIHVAVIRKEQILTNLKELYTLLKYDPDTREQGLLPHHMVLISGPSKTADIELVMVHGAHGPRALYLYVITG